MIRRRVALLATVATMSLGIFGCSSQGPDTTQLEPVLRSAVLAVPGVTGGAVTFFYAELSPRAVCSLTSDKTSKAELVATLDATLKAVTDVIRPYPSGSVRCSITSGELSAVQADLGLPTSITFDALRARYPA